MIVMVLLSQLLFEYHYFKAHLIILSLSLCHSGTHTHIPTCICTHTTISPSLVNLTKQIVVLVLITRIVEISFDEPFL